MQSPSTSCPVGNFRLSAFTPIIKSSSILPTVSYPSFPLLPLVNCSPNSNAETSATSPASDKSDPTVGSLSIWNDPTADPFCVEKYLRSPGGTSSLSACEHESNYEDAKLLCQVCGDKASGFHYGVHACEGCKGFFRRSIQQKLSYRPCSKNQQCSVLRINRNRCQYCRLKKCISVGMSRDAVRFGRVPKSEKERMRREMALAASRSRIQNFNAQLADEHKLASAIVLSHVHTCDFTIDKVSPFMAHFRALGFTTDTTSTTACPLNPRVSSTSCTSFTKSEHDTGAAAELTEKYSPAIRSVVDFAKCIPAFPLLSQADQVTLLKAGMFEVLLLRLSSLFDAASHSVLLLDGSVYKQRVSHDAHDHTSSRFLVDSLFEFVTRFNALGLRDADIALYCAQVLITPDRAGLDNIRSVEYMHQRISNCLQRALLASYPNKPDLYKQLFALTDDLRTLNMLHQEKLRSCKVAAQLPQPISAPTIRMQPTPPAVNEWHTKRFAQAEHKPAVNSASSVCSYASIHNESTDQSTSTVIQDTSSSDTDSENSTTCTNATLQQQPSQISQKHQMLALLLGRPSVSLDQVSTMSGTASFTSAMDLSQLSTRRASVAHLSTNSSAVKMETEEQPLNLCIRT